MNGRRRFIAKAGGAMATVAPMAAKVHASFTKFQALVGPWDHVAEGAYHRFVVP